MVPGKGVKLRLMLGVYGYLAIFSCLAIFPYFVSLPNLAGILFCITNQDTATTFYITSYAYAILNT